MREVAVSTFQSFFKITFLIVFLAVGSMGCSGAGTGNQFTLDVTGSVVVGDPVLLKDGKLGVINPGQPQVIIGTALVEVTDNFSDGLEVNFLDFNAQAEIPDLGTIQLSLTPQITDNGGILYKTDADGIPFGDSFLDADITTTIKIPNVADQVIPPEFLSFQATSTDPNQLPVLGNIPVINFLFNNQDKSAEITELLITLTPEIIDELD